MTNARELLCTALAGVTLLAAAPVFADSFHDRDYYRHGYRDYQRYGYHGYDRRHVVVVERPYVVRHPYIIGRPVYVQSAPSANLGPGAAIGAAIGSIIDNRY